MDLTKNIICLGSAVNISGSGSSDDVYTKTETDSLLNAKADKTNTYTKSETNELLNSKANIDNVYTKTQTDNLLNNKANVGVSYTKAEDDNLLSAKANSNDVYKKNQTYTQTEVNNVVSQAIQQALEPELFDFKLTPYDKAPSNRWGKGNISINRQTLQINYKKYFYNNGYQQAFNKLITDIANNEKGRDFYYFYTNFRFFGDSILNNQGILSNMYGSNYAVSQGLINYNTSTKIEIITKFKIEPYNNLNCIFSGNNSNNGLAVFITNNNEISVRFNDGQTYTSSPIQNFNIEKWYFLKIIADVNNDHYYLYYYEDNTENGTTSYLDLFNSQWEQLDLDIPYSQHNFNFDNSNLYLGYVSYNNGQETYGFGNGLIDTNNVVVFVDDNYDYPYFSGTYHIYIDFFYGEKGYKIVVINEEQDSLLNIALLISQTNQFFYFMVNNNADDTKKYFTLPYTENSINIAGYDQKAGQFTYGTLPELYGYINGVLFKNGSIIKSNLFSQTEDTTGNTYNLTDGSGQITIRNGSLTLMSKNEEAFKQYRGGVNDPTIRPYSNLFNLYFYLGEN